MASPPSELTDFSVRLQTARETAIEKTRVRESVRLGLAWRVSLELVAAIAVGGGIGLFLDRGLGTSPWFMVLFLLLGGIAGTLNVYRISQGLDESVGLGQARRSWEEWAAERTQADVCEQVK